MSANLRERYFSFVIPAKAGIQKGISKQTGSGLYFGNIVSFLKTVIKLIFNLQKALFTHSYILTDCSLPRNLNRIRNIHYFI